MITITNITWIGNKPVLELAGLSTDAEPLIVDGYKVTNGSTLLLMDTGKVKMFNEETGEWGDL